MLLLAPYFQSKTTLSLTLNHLRLLSSQTNEFMLPDRWFNTTMSLEVQLMFQSQ